MAISPHPSTHPFLVPSSVSPPPTHGASVVSALSRVHSLRPAKAFRQRFGMQSKGCPSGPGGRPGARPACALREFRRTGPGSPSAVLRGSAAQRNVFGGGAGRGGGSGGSGGCGGGGRAGEDRGGPLRRVVAGVPAEGAVAGHHGAALPARARAEVGGDVCVAGGVTSVVARRCQGRRPAVARPGDRGDDPRGVAGDGEGAVLGRRAQAEEGRGGLRCCLEDFSSWRFCVFRRSWRC